MFSKNREPDAAAPSPAKDHAMPAAAELRAAPPQPMPMTAPEKPRPKAAASVLSTDLTITGNVRSSGDIQIEGNIEGDVRSHSLVVGETATVKGEVVAEEVVVHGRVVGRLRGLKVRLSTSARVEGDIVHKTIAIESGAHFEGSVQRQEDPLGKGASEARRPASPVQAPGQAPGPAPTDKPRVAQSA